jgi:hypothetical protein
MDDGRRTAEVGKMEVKKTFSGRQILIAVIELTQIFEINNIQIKFFVWHLNLKVFVYGKLLWN